jgi:hypothetical protein
VDVDLRGVEDRPPGSPTATGPIFEEAMFT